MVSHTVVHTPDVPSHTNVEYGYGVHGFRDTYSDELERVMVNHFDTYRGLKCPNPIVVVHSDFEFRQTRHKAETF